MCQLFKSCEARNAPCLAIILSVMVVLFAARGWGQGPELMNGGQMGVENLKRLLKNARDELQVAKLPAKEIRLRLKIVESVATVKSYFPHADGGLPETRNAKYWTQDDDGCFIPRDKATEAIKDLWLTTSGIRCRKLSSIVMLKGLIDVADAKRLAELDDMLRRKVIPNDLPDDGIGTLFEQPSPKHGETFQVGEFLAGDEIWFENPYFDRLNDELQSRCRGQEGHHVFYVGGGQVMDMYGREPIAIEAFRRSFLRWRSVKEVASKEGHEPTANEFQVKSVRRVILK